MRWLILLLLCSPAWATWTCADGGTSCTVTTARDCSTSTTSCNITVSSTTGGSVGVLCVQMSGTTNSFASASGGGTWVVSAASKGTDTTGGTAQCAYNLNMTAATTTVTCTFTTGTAGNQCNYLNFTGTGSGFTFDVGNFIDDSVACTSCSGVVLTLGTANNYVLVQASSCGGSCSAISQYVGAQFFNNDGLAYKVNVSVPGTTPNWTMTSSKLAGAAIAIYETTGATPSGSMMAGPSMVAGPSIVK
jgi:hypothetical protein